MVHKSQIWSLFAKGQQKIKRPLFPRRPARRHKTGSTCGSPLLVGIHPSWHFKKLHRMALGSVEVEVFQFILRRAESPQTQRCGWLVNFLLMTAISAPTRCSEKIPRKTHRKHRKKIQTTCSPFSEVLNNKATWLLSTCSS